MNHGVGMHTVAQGLPFAPPTGNCHASLHPGQKFSFLAKARCTARVSHEPLLIPRAPGLRAPGLAVPAIWLRSFLKIPEIFVTPIWRIGASNARRNYWPYASARADSWSRVGANIAW